MSLFVCIQDDLNTHCQQLDGFFFVKCSQPLSFKRHSKLHFTPIYQPVNHSAKPCIRCINDIGMVFKKETCDRNNEAYQDEESAANKENESGQNVYFEHNLN